VGPPVEDEAALLQALAQPPGQIRAQGVGTLLLAVEVVADLFFGGLVPVQAVDLFAPVDLFHLLLQGARLQTNQEQGVAFRRLGGLSDPDPLLRGERLFGHEFQDHLQLFLVAEDGHRSQQTLGLDAALHGPGAMQAGLGRG